MIGTRGKTFSEQNSRIVKFWEGLDIMKVFTMGKVIPNLTHQTHENERWQKEVGASLAASQGHTEENYVPDPNCSLRDRNSEDMTRMGME